MTEPSRQGRWGIRQINRHGENCGGTINLGWPTQREAEAANPAMHEYTFEAFDRWPDPASNGSEATP